MEFKRVGTSAVLRMEELDKFMYIMRESDRVAHFVSGARNHYVYGYRSSYDFIIVTEIKPGWARVPDIFTTTGHLL